MRAPAAAVEMTPAQREAAAAGCKTLMPIGGRPFLDYILSSLADAGCNEVAVVVGPAQRRAFAGFERPEGAHRTSIALVEQPEPRGTADAVLAAAGWLADAPFLVVNGDNLYPSAVLRDLVALQSPGLAVFDADDLVRSGNIPAARVAEFALVEVTRAGQLAGIVEKPAGFESARAAAGAPRGDRLVSMNAWRFDPRIFDACRDVAPSLRGECELPDAVMLAMSRGVPFTAVPAAGPVLDLSRQLDIVEVTRRLIGITPCP